MRSPHAYKFGPAVHMLQVQINTRDDKFLPDALPNEHTVPAEFVMSEWRIHAVSEDGTVRVHARFLTEAEADEHMHKSQQNAEAFNRNFPK